MAARRVRLTDRASAASTCPFRHYPTFLRNEVPASCMRGLGGGRGLAPIEPIVQRKAECKPSEQRQQNEPIPLHAPDWTPREIHAQYDQHEKDIQHEAESELVLEDGAETMKLEEEPVDKEAIRY